MTVLSIEEATRRLRADHELLLGRIADLTEPALTADHVLDSGPLGDFCESLRDLVAHVLMWDEINLAVLSEARAGRAHWSLDARWTTPEAGRSLNRGGVEAGRHLPVPLLLHRFRSVGDAMLAEFDGCGEQDWTGTGPEPVLGDGIGALAQEIWTVPGRPAFWHAAIHLNHPAAGGDAR
jgi:hypothetical protein